MVKCITLRTASRWQSISWSSTSGLRSSRSRTCLQLVSPMNFFKLHMSRIRVCRRCCGVPWTGLAICSHDQGRIQLLACGSFSKTGQTPTRDRRCVRVSNFFPPFVEILSRQVADGRGTHLMLASFIGP